ncbi:pantoate--beta-alanine ligase [bacterium]|nr:pantoate--beta-alanine ligase [bacterium]
MKIIKRVSEVRSEVKNLKDKKNVIGLVPTMGAIHQGHISLVRGSKKECNITVVSIFVNPTQFGPSEDYEKYPRDIQRDILLLQEEGVDILFMPSVEEMYGKKSLVSVEVSELSEKFEGNLRPGHFKGVCTVVCKLFNIISPDKSYFGWKDAQQLVIIKKMVKDLNMPIEIVGCQIFREQDGLAMSSRNVYLSPEDRKNSIALYSGLKKIKDMVEVENIRDTSSLIVEGKRVAESFSGVELDYLSAVDTNTLEPLDKIKGEVLILGAIKIAGVRLLDNILIKLK